MPKKLSTCGLIICSLSAFTLVVGLSSAGNSADNLDQLLGVTAPAPRSNPPSLRPAPTPTQAETRQASRGDLRNLQSSGNNQFNPNPPPPKP